MRQWSWSMHRPALSSEAGQAGVEYPLILGVIVMAVIIALQAAPVDGLIDQSLARILALFT